VTFTIDVTITFAHFATDRCKWYTIGMLGPTFAELVTLTN